jgi:hexosaminidase
MKVFAVIFFALLVCLVSLNAEGSTNVIIPKPRLFIPLDSHFHLNDQTHYYSDAPLALNAVNYLQEHLLLQAGYKLKTGQSGVPNTIDYLRDPDLKQEAYTLDVTADKIVIRANSQAGFFYATVSLMQLMDPVIWSLHKSDVPRKSWMMPSCSIEDAPRFQWRGMMLDTARNFFSVAYVKKFIDRMAQHKLNLFHWHLTDDEGWRIEIKKYPLLTQIGAKRGPGTALPFSFYPAMRGPKDKLEEGYYTQDEIREIVAYAAKRSVNVLPEIDIPAHAKAAVTAYPELLQDPNDKSRYTSIQKVSNNTIDAGLESTYVFLENIVKEVTTLFPFEYIHLGGDEIPKGAWSKSPAVEKLMQTEQLKNIQEVQDYFFTEMDRILARHDRKMVAWQEVREHNTALRDDTIIIAWRGNGAGVKAAKKQQKVIMAPAQYLYFDQQYVKSSGEPGHTWAGPTDTQDAYSYDPTAQISDEDVKGSIQGVHGCLWSERAPTEAIADYLAWPRIFSLSEIAWSPQKERNWDDFKRRAFGKGMQRLESQTISHRDTSK